MTESRRRRLLSRRLHVIRHAEPEEALDAMLEPMTGPVPVVDEPAADVSRETSADHPLAPYVAGGQVPGRPPFQADAVAALQEEPPPLTSARILRLEALTAQWVRDVRVGGPGPDDTLLYGAPTLPPVPPPASSWQPVESPPPAVNQPEEAQARSDVERGTSTAAMLKAKGLPPGIGAEPARKPPVRVSDWVSRHDDRSLEYAVAEKLRRPVPVQDFLLEHGPILDQGTTPPLSVRAASACVGMAWAAAVNVLRARLIDVPGGPPPLDVDAARRLYDVAQGLDHVAGKDYPGTSVNAGAKAARELGYIGAYYWGLRGTRDVAQALLQLHAPVVLGVPWTSGLEDPDRHGVIRPTGTAAGGHALVAIGIRRQLRPARAAVLPGPFFVLQQSRGEEEGDAGLVYLHHADLGRMLAGVGEAAVPIVDEL